VEPHQLQQQAPEPQQQQVLGLNLWMMLTQRARAAVMTRGVTCALSQMLTWQPSGPDSYSSLFMIF
jgi:hypothetical protein